MSFEVNMWFRFVGGSGFPISPGSITALAYSDEDGILYFMRNSAVPSEYFTIPAYAILDIQIDGRIVSSGGGFGGGGFGLVGIATGMLAAGALNAMTRHSEIQTFVRIMAAEGEVILFTNAYTPQVLRTVLSPLYTGVEKWTRLAAAALSDERDCPFCAERIKRAAVICRFCGRDVTPADTVAAAPPAPRPIHESQSKVDTVYAVLGRDGIGSLCPACASTMPTNTQACDTCGEIRSEQTSSGLPIADRTGSLDTTARQDIDRIVKLTDDLDAIYDRRSTTTDSWILFSERYLEMIQSFRSIYPLLPKHDARMMLGNVVQGYRNVGGVWMGNLQGSVKEAPDAAVATARMRKVLLNKVIEGDLKSEEVEVLEILREQDQ
jgi:hypothetical protein